MEHSWIILTIFTGAIGIIAVIAAGNAAIALGLIRGEASQRIATYEDMRLERDLLKDTIKTISETHNSLVMTQKMQGEMMDDLNQKVTFMVQGIKGK